MSLIKQRLWEEEEASYEVLMEWLEENQEVFARLAENPEFMKEEVIGYEEWRVESREGLSRLWGPLKGFANKEKQRHFFLD